jgi:hypothetical protein
MLDYELGHFALVRKLFEDHERRDAAEVIPTDLPEPIPFESQRDFVRATLRAEVDLRARRTEIVPLEQDSPDSIAYREHMNSDGSPSETVANQYLWRPGTELASRPMRANA